MKRTRAVVLDFDGVLVESVDVKTRAFATLYSPYGPEIVDQVVTYHLEHGGISRFAKFRHFHRHLLCIPIDEMIERELGERFSQLVEDAVVACPWVAGAKEFLEAYHERLPIYVASGTPSDELQRIIRRRGMHRYFSGIYGSPESKGAILKRVSVGDAAGNVLMVGDAMTDYEGAVQAGVRFVGRLASGQPNPFPQEITVIPDLTALPDLL